MAQPGYSIGEAARASGLSPKTIRYYERIGLIPRAPRHDGFARTGGNRVYGRQDVERLKFIRHARMLDLSLEEIGHLVAALDEGRCPSGQPEYGRTLAAHLERIDKRLAHLHGLRRQIEGLLERSVNQDAQRHCSWETCGCLGAEGGTAKTGP